VTPNTNYSGPDSFTFYASDGTNVSPTATIHITVQNHAPVAQWTSPATLTSTAIMNMNTSMVLTLTATDVGDEPLTYSIVTPPAHGTWNLSSNQFTYTPAPGYAGLDSFTYKAGNGYLDSNVTTVNLDVCVLAVNFQSAASAVPQGYFQDTGAVFNVTRGYGWDKALGTATFAPASGFTVTGARAVYSFGWNPDPRMDTFALTGPSTVSTWTCNLPNGNYYVTLGCGYKENRYTVWDFHQDVISVQGNLVVSNANSDAMGNPGFVVAGGIPVTVSNGQLTVAVGGAAKPTRLDYIEVRSAYQHTGAATFVTQDNATQGNWKGVYGAEGHIIATGPTSFSGRGIDVTSSFNAQWFNSSMESCGKALLEDIPTYAMETGLKQAGVTAWAFPTADARALQYPVLDTRVAACCSTVLAAGGVLSSDLNLADGQTHRVALYCLDWGNAGWAQTIDILDAADKTVLDSRAVSGFASGTWLSWDITGHVVIRVTCTVGSAALSGIFFGISAAPSIYGQPADVACRTGQNATLSVRANGSPLFYQWQRMDKHGTTWGDVSGATVQDYTLVPVLVDDGAKFRCVVFNATGTVLSDPATLTANDTLPAPPAITSPLTVTAAKDSAFNYTIQAANNPTYGCYMPVGGWTFTTSTVKMATASVCVWHGMGASSHETTGTLYIPISAVNAGGIDQEMLMVIVNPTNAPVVNSVLTATTTVGGSFTYTITGTYTPTNFAALNLPAWLTLTGAVLSGTPPPSATGKAYVTISAINASGTGMAQLVITINSAANAPVVNSALAVTGTVGSAFATYTITAANAPTSFNATGLPAGLSVNTNSGAITGTPAAAAVGTTKVTISAANSHGTGSATLNIVIRQSPVFTLQPASQTVDAGTMTTFMVDATGEPMPTYQWQRNGTNIPGATASTLTFAAALADNGAQYRCVVSNLVGAVLSDAATLSLPNYTITASAGTGGTITPSGAVTVSQGSSQAFTIATNTGYQIWNVLVDGVPVGAASQYAFTNVLSDHTIAATFLAYPRFTALAGGANGICIDISDCSTGKYYALWWRTNLISGSWQSYTNVPGTGDFMRLSFTNGLPQVFLQIRVSP
jgi:hypothetical protein